MLQSPLPVCCEGSCSGFAQWLLSQHPDRSLSAIFARVRDRSRLSRLATFTVSALIGAALLGCSRPSDAAAGARTTSSYQLSVKAPAPGAVGQTSTATIQVLPRGPYKINLEFPLKLKVRGPAGAVEPIELQLGLKQAAKLTKGELLLKPALKLVKAGSHPVSGTLRFSVCTDAQCEIKQEAVSWTAVGK